MLFLLEVIRFSESEFGGNNLYGFFQVLNKNIKP